MYAVEINYCTGAFLSQVNFWTFTAQDLNSGTLGLLKLQTLHMIAAKKKRRNIEIALRIFVFLIVFASRFLLLGNSAFL